MRSLIESAFYALTNHEKDKADALLREFMIQRSRQIHESIRLNGDLDLEAILKEDDTQEPVSVFEYASEGVEVIDQEPGAYLVVPNGEHFDVIGVATMEEAHQIAQVVSNNDGGEIKPASKEDLVELFGESAETIIGNISQVLPSATITDMFSDGIESFVSDELPATVIAVDVTNDVADADQEIDDAPVEPQEPEVEVSDNVASLGSDMRSLVQDFESEIEKTTLGEASLLPVEEVTSNVDGVDALGGKVHMNAATGVAAARDVNKAKPVVVKSTQHVGYDREAAPKADQIAGIKNSQGSATEQLSGINQGEPKDTLINSLADAEKHPSIFDKKI